MRRPISIALVAAVLGAVVAHEVTHPRSAAAAKDDPAVIKKKRDDLRAKLKEEKKFAFWDLSYAVDVKAVGELRWEHSDPPPFNDLSEKKGGQFFAQLPLKTGDAPMIKVLIQKLIHKEGNSEFNISFDHAGMSGIKTNDKNKLAEGFCKDWLKQATDPVTKECVLEPKGAKGMGPADVFTAAVATDKESKNRERREWYLWLAPNATYVAAVTYPQYDYYEKAKLKEKVVDFFKNMKELKNVPGN